MAVVLIQRTAGYTISVDETVIGHVTDDQAHDLSKALRDVLSGPKPRAVTPAKWRTAKP